jgi:hypothetical protein
MAVHGWWMCASQTTVGLGLADWDGVDKVTFLSEVYKLVRALYFESVCLDYARESLGIPRCTKGENHVRSNPRTRIDLSKSHY